MSESTEGNQMEIVPHLTCCPSCHSEYVLYIRGPQQAKWVNPRKRYLCLDCNSGFYVESQDQRADPANEALREHQRHFDFYRARSS